MAGVISRGIQGPIIREGDDIVDIVVQSVYASEKEDNYTLKDRDIIAVTESVVARAQGNYASIEAIAAAVGVSVQDAASAIFATVPPRSLDERAYDDDDSESLGAVVSDGEEDAAFDRLALRSAIENLPDLWRRIIILRYFHDLSQERVARMLGLTQVKVSREEKKIMATLKKELS